MTLSVSKSQFKPSALKYFRRIEQTGEELIITDHNRPVLKIVPYSEDMEEKLAGLRNTVLRYDDPLSPASDGEWEALK